jgi:hypothetical protein
MNITVNEAQKRLAVVWTTGTAISFLLLFWVCYPARIFRQDEIPETWQWLLPLTIPFLTLIVTSVAAEAHRQNPSTAKTSDLAFALALWISVIYFVAVFCSLLAVLLTPTDKSLVMLKTSNFWLTPIQTLLSIAMGVFFTQRRRR